MKSRGSDPAAALRVELERQIETGQCAYCREPARPDGPLTREHVIPRARGGGRKDVRIIVPACCRCNQERGCQDLIPFLLSRPRRISCVLDYLALLSPMSLREVDLRVFAELYAAIAMLHEVTSGDAEWRRHRERLCSGRSLHRRRYAARRAILMVAARLAVVRERGPIDAGPGCLLPVSHDAIPIFLEEPVARLEARLLGLLALSWSVPAITVVRQMERAVAGTAMARTAVVANHGEDEAGEEGDRLLEEDQVGRRRRSLKVDRRRGQASRTQRRVPRGRAA